MASADRAQLIAELVLDDKFTKPLARIDKRMGAFSGAVNRNLGRGIDTAVSKIGRGLVTVGKGVVSAAIDWEDAFTGVVKTVKATPAELDQISDSLRKMSTEMPNTAQELAGIAEAGGAMGIAADDIDDFTKQVAILASTTDVSADDAATALGQLQNVLHLTGEEFDNFAATLVELGNTGSSTESQILEIAKRSGNAATRFGLAKDAVLGFASAAANLGINSESAGTNLGKMYSILQRSFSKGGKTIQTVTGKTAKQLAKAFGKDPEKAITGFLKSLSKLKGAARDDAIEKIFGRSQAIKNLVNGLADSLDTNLTPALDSSEQAWKDQLAAQEEFDKRNKTVKSSIQRLRNVFTDLAITVGEGIAPALGRAADKLSDFLKIPANRQALKDLGADVGRLIDGVDWASLIGYAKDFMGALKSAGGYAKTLWDAFSSAPTEVKGMLLSLAAVSKLTGGAPIKFALDVGKDVFGHFFERGSSPANPMFVSGLGGTPVPGAGGAGGLLGLLKGFILPVAVATIAAEAWQGLSTQLAAAISGGNKDQEAFFQRGFDQIGTMMNPIGTFILNLDKNIDSLTHLDRIPGELEQIAVAIGLLKPKPVHTGANLPGPPGGGGGLPNRPGGPGGGARSSKELERITANTKNTTSQVETSGDKVTTKMGVVDQSIIKNRDAVRAAETAVRNGAISTSGAARTAGGQVTGQSVLNTNRIVGAFHGIPTPIVNVTTNVTANGVTQSQTTVSRSSLPTSRGADNDRGK